MLRETAGDLNEENTIVTRRYGLVIHFRELKDNFRVYVSVLGLTA